MSLIELNRTTFKITTRCTLKCKLCIAFIPYFQEQTDISFDDAKLILKNYFSIVDSVGTFSITGGEPLVNKDLVPIMEEVYKYSDQIKQYICIVTNGTLTMKDDVLDALSAHKKIMVVISNYGPDLSRKFEALIKALKSRDINYRIDNYQGDSDDKYGGWIDYRDHSLKHTTNEAVKKQAQSCFFWTEGPYYEINFGELHPCSRSFWRMHSEIMVKDQRQYIDLLDNESSIDEKRVRLTKISQLVFLNACAYCSGNREDTKRYKPAEQL
jgi:organic radical activating enzyme